jgi:hypothetical protein
VVEQKEILTRGGIYLAKLDPAKAAEVGKICSVAILNCQTNASLELSARFPPESKANPFSLRRRE